jgi:hypothetical protein
MTRAIIFVPAKDFEPHADRCLAHCEAQGYEFQGIIRGDWDAAQRMMGDGETSVVLVSTEDHLPPNRKPRIEVVANQALSRWETRSRIIRRPGGAG